MEISDYDKFKYDYSTYWKNREYEDLAEHILLEKAFEQIPSGNWFIDIGGSYGRLIDIYYDKFKHPVIMDYSLETLIKNKSHISEKYPKVILIAANVYKLPFAESSLDSALMVRVLHHLNQQDTYFKELRRVLKSNGIYIQEFANKIHLKARFRAILKGNFKFFNKNPYQQPAAGNFEGTKEQPSIFLNYHPRYIRGLFKKADLKIIRKSGCSYLRIPYLKEKLGTERLIKLERFFQKTLSWTNISPSIFFTGKSLKEIKEQKRFRSLEEILVCPECKNPLHFSQEKCKCIKCGRIYSKINDIWDFRLKE